MSRVVLQGQLRSFGLLNTVQFLCGGGLTGALRIYQYGLTFTIYMDKGYMVSASSPDQEPVGARLLRKGKVTPAQLDRALGLQRIAEQRGKHLPIGRVLVHQKMISARDLEECVFDQIIETICLSLELPDPYFSFARLDLIHPAKFRAFVHFQFALLEAFRIADEIRRKQHENRGAARPGGGRPV
ncbi:MAG: DUF4388 domain-containing protein [Thermoleophilia bacterium]|nr:DUF4388 domain-containing protein [Thermoleophilia bacterium]